MKKLIIFLTTYTLLTMLSQVNADQFDSVVNLLGWQSNGQFVDQNSKLCGGYYQEPKNVSAVSHPPPYDTTQIIITARGSTIFRTNGESVLQDHVVIQQPGRIINADKAVVYRNEKTGQITNIHLSGHVRVQEAGKLLAGKMANFDITHNTLIINHAAYHITGAYQFINVQMPINAWGTAKSLRHLSNGISELKEATYSTCSPINPDWFISAKNIRLDPRHQKGYANDVVIRFKKIPIFYTPYYSFPLKAERKSGLLTPSGGYSTDHGFYMTLPYYWNMASNYDLLFTPEWYSQRGIQLNNFFRYLTENSTGQWYASIIPNDRQFSAFRQNTLDSFSGKTVSADVTPYLSDLQKSSSNRIFVNFQNNTIFNDELLGKIALRYVTDPYYPRDFESEYLNDNSNQLPSFAELDYQGLHWQDMFLLQSYQTIHSLDHFTTPAQNQYARLPEVDVNGTYPELIGKLNGNINGQVVHFKYHSDYFPLTYERPIGDRLHIQPSINYPFTSSFAYFTPQFLIDSTYYFSKTPAASNSAPRPVFNVNRSLPIANIDSGLYFDRMVTWSGHPYIQTIEPRFFYLYTPYLNQDLYPNFDTQMLPFSFNDLYSLNRFTGFDRIQNANQLSLGLTSRLLSTTDAQDILTTQLGVITYFEQPNVCLLPGCRLIKQSISPITGNLTFHSNSQWSLNSGLAWDTTLQQINNAQAGVEYQMDNNHIALLNYQFTHANPDTSFETLGFSSDSSLITVGLLWPLTDQWKFFGYTYYNLTQKHIEDEYAGFGYENCCFALRAIVQNNYDGTQQINGGATFQNKYVTNYFVEFLLKGLGSAGNHRAESVLTSTLPGFQDIFSNKGGYGYANQL